MATSYKIRLKRFNGLDYDTLNLSSENIIRNNGNTVEQEFNNIIPSSNGILKNDNGIFNVATLGTDYTAVDDSLTSSTTKTYSINKQKDTFVPFDMLGIVIDGNSTPLGASAGQYVIVKNSTISGCPDGLYTAAQAIPASTLIDATYLTAVSDGGLNDLNRTIKSFINIQTISMPNSTIYSGVSITANPSSGYKFLSWFPTGTSWGWIASFPIYLESTKSKTTRVYYSGTIPSESDKKIAFSFIEILDL